MDPAEADKRLNTEEATHEVDGTLKNDDSGNDEEKVQPVVVKREPEKEFLSWTAPARPFRRRDKQFYVTTISIASLVCLILFLAEGAMPVILIISLIFLYYVMATVEPENIEYKITNKGIKIAGKTTEWDLVGRFWFGKRHDSELLILETFVLPGRMEMVIDVTKKEQIRKTLLEYKTEEEISPSKLDRVVDWFSKKLPN